MSVYGKSLRIIESDFGFIIDQEGSTIKISNINDINILIDILQIQKHKYYLCLSKNYTQVYTDINGQEIFKFAS